jgi:hypothetical protein
LIPLLYLSSSSRLSVELPFYSKFLMIAAYLASYNPQKTDKRFFVKHHGKQRKTAHMVSRLFLPMLSKKGCESLFYLYTDLDLNYEPQIATFAKMLNCL